MCELYWCCDSRENDRDTFVLSNSQDRGETERQSWPGGDAGVELWGRVFLLDPTEDPGLTVQLALY